MRTKAPRTHSTGFRPYLLSGLLRCSRCGDLLRAQPNRLGLTYYREASSLKGKRCPASPLLVRTEYFDLQVDRIIRGLKLPTSWQIRVMQIIGSQEERQKALRERARLRGRLRRLNKRYRYLEIEEREYQRKKRGCLGCCHPGGAERCFASCCLLSMPIRPPEE